MGARDARDGRVGDEDANDDGEDGWKEAGDDEEEVEETAATECLTLVVSRVLLRLMAAQDLAEAPIGNMAPCLEIFGVVLLAGFLEVLCSDGLYERVLGVVPVSEEWNGMHDRAGSRSKVDEGMIRRCPDLYEKGLDGNV